MKQNPIISSKQQQKSIIKNNSRNSRHALVPIICRKQYMKREIEEDKFNRTVIEKLCEHKIHLHA